MEKTYIIQGKADGEIFVRACSLSEIIHYIDMLDCYEYDEWEIYYMGEIGNPIHLSYAGWEPGCRITLKTDDGETFAVGQGTDH